jgi:hypothetical protein
LYVGAEESVMVDVDLMAGDLSPIPENDRLIDIS